MPDVRRREVIALLGAGAAAWPLAARAQQPERVRRIGVLMNTAADDPQSARRLAAFLKGLQQLGWTVGRNPINLREADEMQRAITAFAHPANGGLIVAGGAATGLHREVIIKLAAEHELPALYSDPAFATDGGLIAYGPDRIDQFRQAAGYVDRILKGEKPAGPPVQAPTKYELVINLKTAKALGLEVPPAVLARADEVIE